MKNLMITLAILFTGTFLMAQNGVIKGRVLDENGEPLPGAGVYVEYGGNKIGTTTDVNGNYTIKPLNSSSYTVKISFLGYNDVELPGIHVSADKIAFVSDMKMSTDAKVIGTVVVPGHRNLIDPEDPSKITMLPAAIESLPDNRNVTSILRTDPNIQVPENSTQPIIRGSRQGESTCIVDGVKQRDFANVLPGNSIGQMTIYTGGIPAKYGDVTGGVVIIESKGYFDVLNYYLSTQ